MSPEQFRGKGVVAASDQYPLGIMMWELMVGHRPFDAESPLTVVMQHVSAPLPAIRASRPEVSEAIDSVIARMGAKDPLSPYPDRHFAVQALEAAIVPGAAVS